MKQNPTPGGNLKKTEEVRLQTRISFFERARLKGSAAAQRPTDLGGKYGAEVYESDVGKS